MYYQTLFNGALSGLASSNLMPGIIKIASVILLASLIYSVYTAYAAGGDVRMLGTAAIKYLIVGLVLVYYAAAFQDVNNMFNGVSNYIVSTGPGITDVFGSWYQQLTSYIQSANGSFWWAKVIWHLGQNAVAGLAGSMLLFAAFLLYRVTYLLFSLFYAVYGSILYVCGPLVLALMPATGIGRLSRTYLVNLMIFNAWGLIYAILAELIYALHMNDVNTVLNNATYLNLTVTNPMVILGIASLLYALMIALIPYVASRIVQGDVGATLLTIAGAAVTAATLAAAAAGSAVMGVGGGASYASQSSPGASGGSPPPQPPAGGSAPMPWTPGYNMPGRRPAFSFTHAAGWYGGYAARKLADHMKET